MRILGLDYGDKRIGVAVSDELGYTAQGHSTIVRKNRRHDLVRIAELAANYSVDAIVIGYPVRLDGTEGIQCEKVDRFIGHLEAYVQKPIVKWDETLTTKTAEDILIAANMRREKRKNVIDKLAATLILQDYLDHAKDMKKRS
ncbi:MAG: Holliday junction resolvase RuvX [Deltaproteobacteria bacterium]|nr:Holliday junction resolvase RuvX [Deltaproteobacteria bacterium]